MLDLLSANMAPLMFGSLVVFLLILGPQGRLGEIIARLGEATLTACVIGWQRGAKIFRVHDVRATRRALAMAQAILTA